MASDEIGDVAEAHREQSALKRKLAWRMGFAGLMIVVLLGTLGLFDYLTSKGEPDSALPSAAQPVPEDRKDVTQPVKIAEQPLELAKEVQVAAEPEGSAAPVDKSSPLVEPLPRPPAQPALPRTASIPETKPEIRSSARVQPHSEPKSIPPARPAVAFAPPSPASASTPAQPASPPRVSVPAQPLSPPRAPVPAQTAPPARTAQAPLVQAGTPTPREERYPVPKPAPPRLFSGYALQAGIFTDVRLAEELHAKLTLNGIPSTLEIQVNVGPFKTREEADAARAKMSALGLDSVLHLPKGVKR
jgi:cell division protein FtsN